MRSLVFTLALCIAGLGFSGTTLEAATRHSSTHTVKAKKRSASKARKAKRTARHTANRAN